MTANDRFLKIVKSLHITYRKALGDMLKEVPVDLATLQQTVDELMEFNNSLAATVLQFDGYERFLAKSQPPTFVVYTTTYDKHSHAFFGEPREWEQMKKVCGSQLVQALRIPLLETQRFKFIFQLQTGIQTPLTFEGTQKEMDKMCETHEPIALIDTLII